MTLFDWRIEKSEWKNCYFNDGYQYFMKKNPEQTKPKNNNKKAPKNKQKNH